VRESISPLLHQHTTSILVAGLPAPSLSPAIPPALAPGPSPAAAAGPAAASGPASAADKHFERRAEFQTRTCTYSRYIRIVGDCAFRNRKPPCCPGW
jgi:hypothetical protein